jgi:metal-responsive CopG/Arc/MetJ family transcriptional regulator
MKVLIDLPGESVKALDEIARKHKSARVDVIRKFIQKALDEESAVSFEEAFGSWKKSPKSGDGVAFQRRLRDEDW